MPGSAAQLYEEDFVRWTEQQSGALREAAALGTNLPLDWENLAEEIESLGASQRRELRSRIAAMIEHLLKLEHSPAADPRRGCVETIVRERLNIEDLLQVSPSLRSQLGPMIEQLKPRVARLATISLLGYGERLSRLCRFPTTPRSRCSGTGSRGKLPLSPQMTRGANLSRCPNRGAS